MKYYASGEEPKSVAANRESSAWFSSSYFRSSPSAATGLSFENITPEQGVDETTMRHVIAKIRSIVNDRTEKEIKLKFSHLMEESYLKHQFDLQVLSSPLFTGSTYPFKVTDKYQ